MIKRIKLMLAAYFRARAERASGRAERWREDADEIDAVLERAFQNGLSFRRPPADSLAREMHRLNEAIADFWGAVATAIDGEPATP